jgi:hypothetical protein
MDTNKGPRMDANRKGESIRLRKATRLSSPKSFLLPRTMADKTGATGFAQFTKRVTSGYRNGLWRISRLDGGLLARPFNNHRKTCRLPAIALATADSFYPGEFRRRDWPVSSCLFVSIRGPYSRQFAVGIFAALLLNPNPPKRADAPNTTKVTIKTAPVTICCSSGVTPARPNTF